MLKNALKTASGCSLTCSLDEGVVRGKLVLNLFVHSDWPVGWCNGNAIIISLLLYNWRTTVNEASWDSWPRTNSNRRIIRLFADALIDRCRSWSQTFLSAWCESRPCQWYACFGQLRQILYGWFSRIKTNIQHQSNIVQLIAVPCCTTYLVASRMLHIRFVYTRWYAWIFLRFEFH